MKNTLTHPSTTNLNARFETLSLMTMSLITPLLLTGCMGIYEGGFECPPGEGTKCKSISEVNAMVNQGTLPPASVDVAATSVDAPTEVAADASACGDSCLICGEQTSHAACKISHANEIWWGPGAWDSVALDPGVFMMPDENAAPVRKKPPAAKHRRMHDIQSL